MYFFAELTALTLVIIYLAFRTWHRTHSYSILVGIAALYYWSLAGSWFIVYDLLTNNAGEKFGLHYYHYFKLMFPIQLDQYYAATIAWYVFFIIIVQLVLFFSFRKKGLQIDQELKRIPFNHLYIFIIIIFAIAGSIFFIRQSVNEAIRQGESIYVATRFSQNGFFSLHELCNETALTALFLGLATLLSGSKNEFFIQKINIVVIVGYVVTVIIVETYLILLGNKHDFLFSGLFAFLYLISFKEYKKIIFRTGIFILSVLLPLVAIDPIRGLPIGGEIARIFGIPYLKHLVPVETMSGGSIFADFIFNDEMFPAHMSLYGAFFFSIPITYGTSIISLIGSIVPRSLWPTRPVDIYPYYISHVHASPVEGYTIHHVTGWYLNFGYVGIIIGALLFAFLWVFILKQSYFSFKNQKYTILFRIAVCGFTGFLPNFIRSGIEGYKSLIIEGMLLPCIITIIAIAPWQLKSKL